MGLAACYKECDHVLQTTTPNTYMFSKGWSTPVRGIALPWMRIVEDERHKQHAKAP